MSAQDAKSAREVIAKAADEFDERPHSLGYSLYDFSGYPGADDPHVVKAPNGSEVHRSNDPSEARATYERLKSLHRATLIDVDLNAAGYTIVRKDEVRDAALEEAAKRGDAWDDPSALKLAAGEMTAQELRTARAVARGIAAAIRSMKDNKQ